MSTLLVSDAVDRISWDDAQQLSVRPAAMGERFGPLWATFWLRAVATVPATWAGARVDLLWDSGSEATLWLDGLPAQGLNQLHRDAVLVGEAKGGEAVAFEVELACNGLFGRQEHPAELRRCELARFDAAAWQLFHDFETLRLLAIDPGLDEAWAGELLSDLNRFCNEPDPAILSSLYEHRNATTAHEITAIGHAHLDTAWLWPLAETYRKAVRTFSTQLRYMDEYPEYRFACSQAQQYAWIEERTPAPVGGASAPRSTPGSSCRSAAPGSSPTATSPRASRSCASSCRDSAASRASSGAVAASSGTRTSSDTTASSRN